MFKQHLQYLFYANSLTDVSLGFQGPSSDLLANACTKSNHRRYTQRKNSLKIQINLLNFFFLLQSICIEGQINSYDLLSIYKFFFYSFIVQLGKTTVKWSIPFPHPALTPETFIVGKRRVDASALQNTKPDEAEWPLVTLTCRCFVSEAWACWAGTVQVRYSCCCSVWTILTRILWYFHFETVPRKKINFILFGLSLTENKNNRWIAVLICCSPVFKVIRMPLPELRCKRDHMPKSIVWVLFDSNYEREKEIEREE